MVLALKLETGVVRTFILNTIGAEALFLMIYAWFMKCGWHDQDNNIAACPGATSSVQ
jgi:hypothetical protein